MTLLVLTTKHHECLKGYHYLYITSIPWHRLFLFSYFSSFKRCLPLPTSEWSEVIGDVFCHAHHLNKNPSHDLIPQENDLLIGDDIVMFRGKPETQIVQITKDSNEVRSHTCACMHTHTNTHTNTQINTQRVYNSNVLSSINELFLYAR